MSEIFPTQIDVSLWQCTDVLSPPRYRDVIRAMNLQGFKWDTQIGDIATLPPFALILPNQEWRSLKELAEKLSGELTQLEDALVERRDLWSELGLPRTVLDVLKRDEPFTPAAARIVRYDFHPTDEGWKISEVNSDVPGGFNEASTFTRLMAQNFGAFQPAGDPLSDLAEALLLSTRDTAPTIGLLTAPGYNEDIQVVSGVGAALRLRGIESYFITPDRLIWDDRQAFIRTAQGLRSIGSIYRFHQGEWLSRTPSEKWCYLLRGGMTPVCNPPMAILSESKRLPLLWRELKVNVPAWRKLLPETTQPNLVTSSASANQVLKPAYCNTGDTVISAGWQKKEKIVLTLLEAFLKRRSWIAQRRFHTLAISTPLGPLYPCLGVYTINGKATGIYARLATKPVIDYTARDVAILLRD